MSTLRNQLQAAAAEYAATRCPIDLAADASARLEIDAAQPDYADAQYPGDLAADVRKQNTFVYRSSASDRRVPWIIFPGLSVAAVLALMSCITFAAVKLYEGHQKDLALAAFFAKQNSSHGSGGSVAGRTIVIPPGKSLPGEVASDSTADRLPEMSDALAALDDTSEATTTDTTVDSDPTSTDSPAVTVIQSQDTISASLPTMDTFPSVPSFPSFDASDSSSTSIKS